MSESVSQCPVNIRRLTLTNMTAICIRGNIVIYVALVRIPFLYKLCLPLKLCYPLNGLATVYTNTVLYSSVNS